MFKVHLFNFFDRVLSGRSWFAIGMLCASFVCMAGKKNVQPKRVAQQIKKTVNHRADEPVTSKMLSHEEFRVRVLLASTPMEACITYRLACEGGFYIINRDQPEMYRPYLQESISLCIDRGALYIDGKRCAAQHLVLVPVGQEIHFNGHRYAGSFEIQPYNDQMCLVNQLDLEDYVYCVVRWESWPGWPLEVNKAFAIMCRSYVVSHILDHQKAKRPYHIKCTNVHQTYKGLHESTELRAAVKETANIILTYNNMPIKAMFDCCCGGLVPAHMEGVDFTQAPYLARTEPCSYCSTSKIYTWEADCTFAQLEKLLAAASIKVKRIKDIAIEKVDKAGVVHQVRIETFNGTHVITGKKMYSLLSSVKSYSFSLAKVGKSIRFSGRGYGHHLGLCQWGARKMIDHGFSYRDILSFYYPQTSMMQVKTRKEQVSGSLPTQP